MQLTKFTPEQWAKMSREERSQAVINFQEPDTLYNPERIDNRMFRKEKV